MRNSLNASLFCLAVCFLAAPAARATLSFTQLDDDMFMVTHRVKVIGSRGKATEMVYTKAASLCIAAGYTYMRVLDQESAAAQEYEAANASLRVQFFPADGEDRMSCKTRSDAEYVAEAQEKLASQGYQPPAAPEERPMPPSARPQAAGGALCNSTCTIGQVAAMARTGLSDDQILAACPGGS
jgi:hypothetical protein